MYDGPPRPSLSTKRWFTTASEGHRTGFETKPSLSSLIGRQTWRLLSVLVIRMPVIVRVPGLCRLFHFDVSGVIVFAVPVIVAAGFQ